MSAEGTGCKYKVQEESVAEFDRPPKSPTAVLEVLGSSQHQCSTDKAAVKALWSRGTCI